MANLNKVFLMGNLTRDPELRATAGGTNVCKFGLAINRKWTGSNGQAQESVCFVDVTAFGRQAEVINQYCTKGKPLFVEGRLEYSTWQSQDGQKKNKLEVIVENFQFIGAAGSKEGGGGRAGKSDDARAPAEAGGGFGEEAAGEIPF
jgi:single-strand DNA-binding protein